jgi:hypothetical protein
LSLRSHEQEQPCGTSNITLNGIYLPQEWNGDSASGSGSYSGVTDLQQNAWYLQRQLDLEWTSACLRGIEETDEAAQVLTVTIKGIDGKLLDRPSGFTVSFKQHTSPPSLLRLESTPNPSASNKESAQSWREPPTHLRLTVVNSTVDPENLDAPVHSIEDNIRELKALQFELQLLQQAVAEKKKFINSQLRKEVKDFTEEINECHSISCIIKTITHKAHGAWKIAIVRFQSYRRPEEMGRPEDLDAYAQAYGHVPQLSGLHMKVPPGPQASSTSELDEEPPYDLPPRPPKPSPYVVALEITLGLLCCGCLIATIRHKCSSLRTRTDRAAAREERHNLAAYRRAARKHAWRRWWRGNWRRDDERIADYEEKRALIQEQEDVLENAMQEEIRQLREAHNVVNDLVRDCEEGRAIRHASCNCHRTAPPVVPYSPSLASTYPPTSLPELPSRPLSRTDTLPSYRSGPPSEPPNYESEVDMAEVVANGFRQYRSSTISSASGVTSHWTPDSSVVDVSPRPSAETLRYSQSVFNCEESEEK